MSDLARWIPDGLPCVDHPDVAATNVWRGRRRCAACFDRLKDERAHHYTSPGMELLKAWLSLPRLGVEVRCAVWTRDSPCTPVKDADTNSYYCKICHRPMGIDYDELAAERDRLLHRCRPAVLAFADAMEHKLRANDHKGGWSECEVEYLLERLRAETKELTAAARDHRFRTLKPAEAEAVLHEAADVANFAMMIADICGGLR